MHAVDPLGADDAYGPFHRQATSRKLAPVSALSLSVEIPISLKTKNKKETFFFFIRLLTNKFAPGHHLIQSLFMYEKNVTIFDVQTANPYGHTHTHTHTHTICPDQITTILKLTPQEVITPPPQDSEAPI